MRTKPPKKPQRAKCPECGERTLTLNTYRIVTTDYVLLENGYEGQEVGDDYGETDTGTVYCSSCYWETDEGAEYAQKLNDKFRKKVNNAST